MNSQKARTAALSALLVASTLLAGFAGAQGTLAANAGPDKTLETGQSTTFDGSASTGTIVSYSWNFGDGSSGSGVTVSKSYTSAGTYTVTLTVIGSDGSTASDTATVTVRTTDSTAPNITHTPVTSGTSNSAISVTATVTDNIGVQTVTLYYKRSNESTYNSSTLTCSGGATSKSCEGSIPASVTDGSAVQYYVHASDTKTPTANTNTYPAGAPTSNLTVTLTDTAAPTITHTPPGSATSGQNVTVTATITDAVGTSSASLNYRFGTNGTFGGSFTTVAMTRASGTALDGSYTATVAMQASATEFQYYITANDSSSNNGTFPSSAPGCLNTGTCSNTTIGIVSALAPTITVTSSPTTVTPGVNATITATVSASSGRGITNVTLRYRAASSGDFVSVAMTNATSASVYTGTIPGANVSDYGIQWFVRANDTGGDTSTSPSGGSSAPTPALAPPGTPSALTATRLATGASLAWTAPATNASDTVASYKVYRSLDGTTYSLLALSTSASYLDSTAVAGTRYLYKVSAVDTPGTEGTQSSAATALATAAPSVTATAGQLVINVSWTAVTGAAYYLVDVSSTNGSFTGTPTNTTGTSASAAGLTAGTLYFVRVTPYGSTHQAGERAFVSATPTAIPASGGGGSSGGGSSGGGSSGGGSSGSGSTGGGTTTSNATNATSNATTNTSTNTTTPTGNATTGSESNATNATPASFALSDLVVPSGLTAGRAATVSATVRNTGGSAGSATATLLVDGAAVGSASVSLGPGASRSVSVTFTPSAAGTFAVSLRLADGATLGPQQVSVAAAPATPTPTPAATPPTATPTTTTAQPTPTPVASPTPEDEPAGTPGFEAVALVAAALAAAYVLRRRK